jgi:hypothetical protein
LLAASVRLKLRRCENIPLATSYIAMLYYLH